MSRLIEVESLIDQSISVLCGGGNEEMAVLVEDIEATPSIDLVRCAECKNCKRKKGEFRGEPIFFYRCEEHNREVESDDYCSWGERSEP